jgi:predicted nucleic acid-binding protein
LSVRIYLDAAPVIYLVERVPQFFSKVQARLSAPNAVLIASHLTRMECKVIPLRNHDELLTVGFDAYFADVVSEMVPLSGAVFDRATEIRAAYGFSTPDSIHLAAATIHGCNVFLTNDLRLDRYSDLVIETVSG